MNSNHDEDENNYHVVNFKHQPHFLDAIRKDLIENIKSIEEKYGIKLTFGTMTYSDFGFTSKMQCAIPPKSIEELVANLKKGDQFKNRGSMYIVREINLEARFCIVTSTRGKRYKMYFGDLLKMIKVKPYNMGKSSLEEALKHIDNLVQGNHQIIDFDFANPPEGDGGGSLTVDKPRRKSFSEDPGSYVKIGKKMVHKDDIEVL